jgi:hypothetical protein
MTDVLGNVICQHESSAVTLCRATEVLLLQLQHIPQRVLLVVKLICPKCMKPVTIPDDFTGQEFTCPACGNAFDVPAKYTPAVLSDTVPIPAGALQAAITSAQTRDQPATSAEATDHLPQGAAPTAPAVPALSGMHASPPPVPSAALATPTPAGYTKSVGITIAPKVVAWLPAAFLTILFFCTLFSWIASSLGGNSVYWQSPWRAIGGWVGKDPILLQSMPGDSNWVAQTPMDWLLMLPFVLCLLVALVLAWAERLVHGLDTRRVPPQLAKVWEWRKVAIAVLSSIALFFMLIQVSTGFGMERAIRKVVHDEPALAKVRDEAKDARAKDAVAIKEESELAKYNMGRTIWQDLGLTCNVLAILTMLLSIQLDRRGDKPPPKLMLHY